MNIPPAWPQCLGRRIRTGKRIFAMPTPPSRSRPPTLRNDSSSHAVSKKVRRVVTSHQLNAEEAAEARRLRELVAKDKDEIIAERWCVPGLERAGIGPALMVMLGQTIRGAASPGIDAVRPRRPLPCVAQVDLSYLEQDQREPSLSIAARIARELEIKLDDLTSTVMR